jgi:hypothetical protein
MRRITGKELAVRLHQTMVLVLRKRIKYDIISFIRIEGSED